MDQTPPPATGRLIYAAGESCADLLYASGVMTPDPFLWYSVPGETGIVLSPLEVGRAQKQARKGICVLSIAQAAERWHVPKGKSGPVEMIRALAKLTRVRHWEVPHDFPYGLAVPLRRSRLVLTPVQSFFPERAVKSSCEVELVREGVQLAEAGLYRAIEILREATVADELVVWRGETLTAEALRGEVDAEIARRGGTASHTITAPGVQGADCHMSGTGPIFANQPVVLDIFPRVDRTGYCGDLTRTVVKGTASPVVRRAYEVVRDAQRKAIAAAAPGKTGKEIHQIVVDTIAASEFPTDAKAVPPRGFFHGTGHGLGLEVHEAPRFSSGGTEPLVIGNVLTVEPGVYYPEWGGVRLEDVVVIQPDGCENLTTAPFELEIE
jgi:Xaa-Pro aminopeptidase